MPIIQRKVEVQKEETSTFHQNEDPNASIALLNYDNTDRPGRCILGL